MSVKTTVKKLCPEFVLNIYRKLRDCVTAGHYNQCQKKCARIKKRLRKEISGTQLIRVGFYVVYDASWAAVTIFEKMLQDTAFDVKVVVCPDTSRGIENQDYTLKAVYNRLVAKYGSEYVLSSCNDKHEFMDFSDRFDIINLANPYDAMTHKYYGINFLVKKNKLVFYNPYGYSGHLAYTPYLFGHCDSYNMFWKMFVENNFVKQIAEKHGHIHGKNIVVSGSCRMDTFSSLPSAPKHERKKIILAPHHTVRRQGFAINLSNFLRFSEFIQELPAKYKDIDFIFRPHPLLFVTLRCDDVWGKEKTDSWLERFLGNKNVAYSEGGDFFGVFNESDAMIQDCGSFLPDYFYTNKPQCYMLESEKQFEDEFTDFGKKLFDYVYKAFSEQDITNFIENVVIKGNDALQKERKEFARREVMVNYPHATDFAVDYLKKELL